MQAKSLEATADNDTVYHAKIWGHVPTSAPLIPPPHEYTSVQILIPYTLTMPLMLYTAILV